MKRLWIIAGVIVLLVGGGLVIWHNQSQPQEAATQQRKADKKKMSESKSSVSIESSKAGSSTSSNQKGSTKESASAKKGTAKKSSAKIVDTFDQIPLQTADGENEKKQVEATLGEPTNTETIKVAKQAGQKLTWKDPDKQKGMIQISFMDNQVVSKSVEGMNSDSRKNITEDEVKKVKSGDSVNTVTDILGKPYRIIEVALGQHVTAYEYEGKQNGKATKISILFTGDKVIDIQSSGF